MMTLYFSQAPVQTRSYQTYAQCGLPTEQLGQRLTR